MTDITTTMDYNTENTIIEIVKKRPIGRPKIFTAEEQKEKTKIISQRYYQNNCEQKKEYVKSYYIENRDAVRERKRIYYLRKKSEKQNVVY